MRGAPLAASRGGARARILILAAAVAAGLTGCTSQAGSTQSVTATGRNLVIVLSAPAQDSGQVSQDVLEAENLAFSQQASQVTSFKLSLSKVAGAKASDDARSAIQNTSAIAYLGEVVPGSSEGSIGITNAQQLLQVSPTDTAQALTQATSAVPGAPASFLESLKNYGRTFARVVPTTEREARAVVAEIEARGARSLYLTDDGSDYGRALTAALKTDGAGLSLHTGPPEPSSVAGSGAQAVFFATASPERARELFGSVASGHPEIKLFAPSALADSSFASSLAATRPDLTVSVPGVLPRNLTSRGRQFTAAFVRAYHHAPQPQAIFGYVAMSSVLDVLKRAGAGASNRATVVHDFFGLRNQPSPMGEYSIDANGDTSLSSFVFERLRGGKLVASDQRQG